MLSNSVCNHTRDKQIGLPLRGILLSLVCLQTELDNMKSYCQLIIKNTISEKRKIAKLCDNGKIYLKKMSLYTVSMVVETKVVIGWFKLQL